MQFKQYTLDPFQEEAISYINQGFSVVVSAATGTGKTLIADYMIDKYLNSSYKIVYTAPIKALSNQKYKDFKKAYGEHAVGLMTGDVVINPRGQVIVMTTEIYRNMLMTKDPFVQDVKYVVFDEIHFINDIERGVVWEESVIFSPEWVRFLCLSATIPNASQFASWISTIKKHEVKVVMYMKRAVPLKHYLFDAISGIATVDELQHLSKYPTMRQKGKKERPPVPDHLELISQIEDQLPCIFFVFSRKECEKKADELAKKKSYLSKEKQSEALAIINSIVPRSLNTLHSVQHIKWLAPRGIAFHHAGLLPALKEAVESLFEKGLVNVLYCTETFAVGVNMPAKSVALASLEKYDGVHFRYLNSKEYFQLAGRAGRRGIDTVGYVYALVENTQDLDKIREFTTADMEPIQSQFRLTINSVVNLINNHHPDEIAVILRSNFDVFVKKQEKENVRIMASFKNRVRQLEKMGYVKNDTLTEKGKFITHVYDNELLIGELCATPLRISFSDNELLIVLAGIVYESRRSDYFSIKATKNSYTRIISILSKNAYLQKNVNKLAIKRMIRFVSVWITGGTFEELLESSNLLEGDVIRFFRRLIDVLRQIRNGTADQDFAERISKLITLIDRNEVRVDF
ncbi:DEAD/DEAH box helicase [Candidatus Woesearchaeota archaeon]|nr:DEAD/DEAH box helicase [Candidatus Woesearchaeota archaeon]HIH38367.1 DEAD/DEAH box helicase [Candidatus Woesearchaeota archaeon]HIH49461.1 DEAD/DEAH box helicase [Candidatus Woesearchaeota archaeon]HIJ04242.1 DEAD/DEAH box helicase [Candidatus Woesearchaeota archaeon]